MIAGMPAAGKRAILASVNHADHLCRTLLRAAGEAITTYRMIADGDRVLVAISGGKDSGALLYVLRHLQSRAPVRFTLAAVTVDGGWGGHPLAGLRRYARALEVPLFVRDADIAGTLAEKLAPGDHPCSLCARLRRGVIYDEARRRGYPTVALGHHADDAMETLLLNALFNGQLKGMPPLLRADDAVTTVIRPLLLADELDIAAFADAAGLPRSGCPCPADERQDLRRPQVKELLVEMEQRFPGARASLLGALARIRETTLADPRWLPLAPEPPRPVSGRRPPPPPPAAALAHLLGSDDGGPAAPGCPR